MQETTPYMPNISHIGDNIMPDETITQEQEQLKRLLKRWHNAESIFIAMYQCAPKIAIASFIMGMVLSFFAPNQISYIVPFFSTPMLGYIFMRIRARRREFLLELTDEDKILLERHSTNQKDNIRREVLDILKSHMEIQLSQELLRPSRLTQDDVLLRATQHTDTAPQDQLLRPTDEMPK